MHEFGMEIQKRKVEGGRMEVQRNREYFVCQYTHSVLVMCTSFTFAFTDSLPWIRLSKSVFFFDSFCFILCIATYCYVHSIVNSHSLESGVATYYSYLLFSSTFFGYDSLFCTFVLDPDMPLERAFAFD